MHMSTERGKEFGLLYAIGEFAVSNIFIVQEIGNIIGAFQSVHIKHEFAKSQVRNKRVQL